MPLGSHIISWIELTCVKAISVSNRPGPEDEGAIKGSGKNISEDLVMEKHPQMWMSNRLLKNKSSRPGKNGISQGNNQEAMGSGNDRKVPQFRREEWEAIWNPVCSLPKGTLETKECFEMFSGLIWPTLSVKLSAFHLVEARHCSSPSHCIPPSHKLHWSSSKSRTWSPN